MIMFNRIVRLGTCEYGSEDSAVHLSSFLFFSIWLNFVVTLLQIDWVQLTCQIIIVHFWRVVLFIISKFSGGGLTTVVPVLDGYVLQKVLFAVLKNRTHILPHAYCI